MLGMRESLRGGGMLTLTFNGDSYIRLVCSLRRVRFEYMWLRLLCEPWRGTVNSNNAMTGRGSRSLASH